MKKDFLNDDFIEDLNVDEPGKKNLSADNLTVEDFNVEGSGSGKKKVKEFKVEDFNEEEEVPVKPKEPEVPDWNKTIIEAEEIRGPKVNSELYKTEDEQENTEAPEQKNKKSKDGEESGKKTSVPKEILSWSMTFLLAAVLALVLKNYVIINATVPTGSMEHTIEPGDDLLGLRLAYINSEPQRGDIIIFRFPDDEEKKFVKRVIGLPGENVKITEGKIYIDDSETPLKETYLKEQWVKGTGPFEYQIPEDSYLVLGDNRNDSMDARYWKNTYVTNDHIIGKAYFIYYPFSRFGSLYE